MLFLLVTRVFTILQAGLRCQRNFLEWFPVWRSPYHVVRCLETDACRTSVSEDYLNAWARKMNESHLSYRAWLLLIQRDTTPRRGRMECKKRIDAELQDLLDEVGRVPFFSSCSLFSFSLDISSHSILASPSQFDASL